MNIQNLFQSIKDNPDQSTLITAALELERQGYGVVVDSRYHGSQELISADERGELSRLPVGIGINFHIRKEFEEETFKLHLLDLDAVAVTDIESPPVIYNPEFTISEFR